LQPWGLCPPRCPEPPPFGRLLSSRQGGPLEDATLGPSPAFRDLPGMQHWGLSPSSLPFRDRPGWTPWGTRPPRAQLHSEHRSLARLRSYPFGPQDFAAQGLSALHAHNAAPGAPVLMPLLWRTKTRLPGEPVLGMLKVPPPLGHRTLQAKICSHFYGGPFWQPTLGGTIPRSTGPPRWESPRPCRA